MKKSVRSPTSTVPSTTKSLRAIYAPFDRAKGWVHYEAPYRWRSVATVPCPPSLNLHP